MGCAGSGDPCVSGPRPSARLGQQAASPPAATPARSLHPRAHQAAPEQPQNTGPARRLPLGRKDPPSLGASRGGHAEPGARSRASWSVPPSHSAGSSVFRLEQQPVHAASSPCGGGSLCGLAGGPGAHSGLFPRRTAAHCCWPTPRGRTSSAQIWCPRGAPRVREGLPSCARAAGSRLEAGCSRAVLCPPPPAATQRSLRGEKWPCRPLKAAALAAARRLSGSRACAALRWGHSREGVFSVRSDRPRCLEAPTPHAHRPRACLWGSRRLRGSRERAVVGA